MPSSARPPGDRLATYRAKRAAAKTPEPFGGGQEARSGSRPGLFVVQMHHARNLHWDLRLEMDGALASWAVPKGPSADPADKRLAMHVEDHPLEYADFEGVIPEGQYGAGPSICWDRGIWVALEDVEQGFAKGKLLFELRGFKLKGAWTLIHTPRAGSNAWLLIKERDAYVDPRGTEAYPPDSIYSGLPVDELPRAAEKAARLAAEAERRGAKRRRVEAGKIEVMKATPREKAFSRAGWVFEIKYDGYRLLAARDGGEARLWSRASRDLTDTFPEIARAVRGLLYEGLILDGEVVVSDEQGIPSFGRLQKRGLLTRRADALRAAVDLPATLYAFDLLAFEGLDVRDLPLLERKALLEQLLPSVGPIRYSDHIAERGTDVYEQATALGLEGVVAKKADSPYRSGRSAHWLKIRALATEDFAVVGYTEPKGSRAGLGALLLAQVEDGRLVYAGSVGTGFSDSLLADLRRDLARLEEGQSGPPCAGAVPAGRAHHWVRPELVAEVSFRERTEDGLLRQPTFERLRDDKRPEECVRSEGEATEREEEPPAPLPVADRTLDRAVHFTNLGKVFWPEAGYTKGDLVEYYRAAAPWILPYLRDRCLVLTRYPDGIHGKNFFQKDAPDWTPEWVRTVRVWSEGSERELDYFAVEDVESLLYIANSAAIPLHIWSSRVASLAQPDWCILDLDPKQAPFTHVVEVALALKALCDEIALPSFVKTSGSSGLHVLVPLGRQLTYEQSQMLGHLLAQVVATRLPQIATIARQVRRREGKVYLDYLQNGHGKLLVAPFSARPVPEAAVSTPLAWDEVEPGLDIRTHTIRTVPERFQALGRDPLRPVLELAPDLVPALERLANQL